MKRTALTGLMLCLLLALAGCAKAPPAPETTPPPGIDLYLSTEQFAHMAVEIFGHLDSYQGLTIQMEGSVLIPEGEEFEDLPVTFAVVRDYTMAGEHGQIGLDCYYEGDLPQAGQNIRIIGTLSSFEDEVGDMYPLIFVQTIAEVEAQPALVLSEADFEHNHD